MVQAKSSLTEPGFAALDVEKFKLFTEDLLNLATPASSFAYKYQPHLLTIMQSFKEKYSQIAGNFPEFKIDYYYVTRGDETVIEPVTEDSVKNLHVAVKGLLPDAKVEFHPVNTQRLLDYAKRRRTINRYIKWNEHPPMSIQDGFIGLVSLADYIEFLKDNEGELNELLFESNVRGYQKNTTVNKQI